MAFQIVKALLVGALLGSCASPTSWAVNTIDTGDKMFNSSRLRHISKEAHSPVAFELVRIGGEIEAFITLTRFHFRSKKEVKVQFSTPKETFEEFVPVNEGAMRVRLSPETTQKVIQTLQDGDEIAILMDGFEETLDPKQFSSSFAEFVGEGHFFQNLFKGTD